eukprot:TRINITY_DN1637_c0_g1_i1.p1 TRINITY_DN1637_c0_g1~~TRINITY_DN1637_c0_g1_i1.p1  ORF type:complete len:825 (-),score=196.86 TRINITY_DN1637_c0_g1_i1:6-2480(-)
MSNSNTNTNVLGDISNTAGSRPLPKSVYRYSKSLSLHLKPVPAHCMSVPSSTRSSPREEEKKVAPAGRARKSSKGGGQRFDKIQCLQPDEEELQFQFEQMLNEREISEIEKEKLRQLTSEEKWATLIDQASKDKLDVKDYLSLLKRKPVLAMQQLVFPIFKPDNSDWITQFLSLGGLTLILKLISEYLDKILKRRDRAHYYSLLNNSVVVLRGIAQGEDGIQCVLRNIDCIEMLFLNISVLSSDRSRALFLSLVSLLGSRDEVIHARLLVVLQQSVLRFMSLLCSSNQTVAATAFTCVNSLIMSNLHQDILLKEALKTEFKEKGIVTVFKQWNEREDLLPSLSSQLKIFSKHLSKEKNEGKEFVENKDSTFSHDVEVQKHYLRLIHLLGDMKHPSPTNLNKWGLLVNYTEQLLSKDKMGFNDILSDLLPMAMNTKPPEIYTPDEMEGLRSKKPVKHSASFGQTSTRPRDSKQRLSNRRETISCSTLQLEKSVWATIKPQISLSDVSIDVKHHCEPYETEIYLDMKRWSAINNMLANFPLPNSESIKSAITQIDEQVLSLSDLETLQSYLPTHSEREKLNHLTRDTKFSVEGPEAFLLALIEIPDIESRLECWQFKLKSPKVFEECKSQHESVIAATTQILGSKNLRALLEIILGFCNLLHIPNEEQTYLSLNSLSKLADLRISKESDKTVLYLVVEYISKTKPDLLHLHKDLNALQKVKDISDMNVLTSQIQFLENGIKKIENFLLTPESEYGLFFVKFEQFLEDFKPTLNGLQRIHKKTSDQFDLLLQYFAVTESTHLFGELHTFLSKYKKTVASFEVQHNLK